MQGQKVLFSSAAQERQTPAWLLDWANLQYGPFTLDAASVYPESLAHSYGTVGIEAGRTVKQPKFSPNIKKRAPKTLERIGRGVG